MLAMSFSSSCLMDHMMLGMLTLFWLDGVLCTQSIRSHDITWSLIITHTIAVWSSRSLKYIMLLWQLDTLGLTQRGWTICTKCSNSLNELWSEYCTSLMLGWASNGRLPSPWWRQVGLMTVILPCLLIHLFTLMNWIMWCSTWLLHYILLRSDLIG